MKQYGAFMSPSDERGYERGDAAGFEVERLSYRLDSQEHLLNELRTRRRDSHLLAMREQLNKSQTDLASTSARYAQLAGEIPRDVSDLSGQLSVILKSAMAEADQIKAEAHAFAESVRGDAERNALELIREAQLEFEAAAELRSGLDAQTREIRAEITQLQEQAAINAREIIREAQNEAEEILAGVHRDVDGQLELARAKLDELTQMRTNIAAQVQEFYERFQVLSRSVEPEGLEDGPWPAPAVLNPRLPADGAHVPVDVTVSHSQVGTVQASAAHGRTRNDDAAAPEPPAE